MLSARDPRASPRKNQVPTARGRRPEVKTTVKRAPESSGDKATAGNDCLFLFFFLVSRRLLVFGFVCECENNEQTPCMPRF